MLFRVKLPLDCLEAIGIYRCLLQTGILGGLFSCFQDYLIKVFLILSWANHWIIFESFSLDIFNGRVICIYHINLPYFMAPLLFNILESGFILASFYFFFFFFSYFSNILCCMTWWQLTVLWEFQFAESMKVST